MLIMWVCAKNLYIYAFDCHFFGGWGGGAGLVWTSFGNVYSLECILDSAILITGKNGKFL